MSEYRRFVAYIYEYTSGKKNKNTGFAKVESRNGSCRMQICLQKLPREEKALNMYGFVREGGWLLGIFLGTLTVRGGLGQARLETPSEKIGGSAYALSQLAGLWIDSAGGRKYLTVFDDEGVDVEKLVTELPKEPKKEREEERAEEAETGKEHGEGFAPEPETVEAEESAEADKSVEAKEIVEAKETVEVGGTVEAEESAEAEENVEAEEIVEAGETVGVEKTAEAEGIVEAEESAEAGKSVEAEKTVEAQKTVKAQKKAPEAGEPAGTTEHTKKGERPEAEEKLCAQEAPACPVKGCPCGKRKGRLEDLNRKWKELEKRCTPASCLPGEELAEGYFLTLKELPLLKQGGWPFGNNSFLMHGLCTYQHLLLGRQRDGGYLLGIPGIFANQELFMANMFGFPEFKEVSRRRPGEPFGYWCRRL